MSLMLAIAGAIAPPSAGNQRGDGLSYGSGTVRRFFEERALEEFVSRLDTIKRKARAAKTKPENFGSVQEAIREARGLVIAPDLLARLDAIADVLAGIANERMAYADAMARIVEQAAIASGIAEQRRHRQANEERIVLAFLAKLNS